MKRESKAKKIDEAVSLLQTFNNFVIFNYGSISHKDLEKIRKSLKTFHAKIKLVKNTFLRKAIHKVKSKNKVLQELSKKLLPLKGSTGLLVFEQEWDKPLIEFNQITKDSDTFTYKGAIIDAVVYEKEAVTYIANLPPKEQIMSKLIGSMKSPLNKLILSLKYNTNKFVYILKNKN